MLVGRAMRSRGQGRILLTGSIAGFMPGTYQAVYNGTKAFVESVFQARRGWFSSKRQTAARPLRGLDRSDSLRSARALRVRPLG